MGILYRRYDKSGQDYREIFFEERQYFTYDIFLMHHPDKEGERQIARLDRYIKGDREWLNGIVLYEQVLREVHLSADYINAVEERYVPVIRRYLLRLFPIALGEIEAGGYYPSKRGAIAHLQSVLDTAKRAGVDEHDSAYVEILNCISELQISR